MSLLTLTQGAARDLSIVVPTTVVSNTDKQIAQLFQLANTEGASLLRAYDWEALRGEATFTTTATATQTAVTTLISDFYGFINNTFWNRTQSRPLYGPVSAQQWQRLNGSVAASGILNWFRVAGGRFLLYPTPASGDAIYFEYTKNTWARSAADAPQIAFLADTDTTVFDEELMRLGVVWRYKSAKGLDYAEAYREYQSALTDITGTDGPKAAIDLTGVQEDYLGINIPEGNWNL